MATDTAVIDKLKERNVDFASSDAVKKLINELDDMGYEGKTPTSYEGLKKAINGIDIINSVEESRKKDIDKRFAQGQAMNEILLRELEELRAKGLEDEESIKQYKALVKEYVEKLGTDKKVDEIKEELAKEIVQNKPEAEKEVLKKEVYKLVDTKLLGFDPEETEKKIVDDRSLIIEEKVKEIKNPIEQKLLEDRAVLKELKKEVVLHTQEIVGEKLSEDQKQEIEKLLDVRETAKIEQVAGAQTGEQMRMIEEEVNKYYDFEELKKEETIGIVKQELKEQGIDKEHSEVFQQIVLKNLMEVPTNNIEKAVEAQIGTIIDKNTHDILYHIIDDEFRRNISIIGSENYSETIFNLMLLRHDVKKNPQLYKLIEINRLLIKEMIKLQVQAFVGPSVEVEAAPAVVGQVVEKKPELTKMEKKMAELKLGKIIGQNKELIALYRQGKTKEVLKKVMTDCLVITPTEEKVKKRVEQKVAIKKYADFVAKSSFPTTRLERNVNPQNWATSYNEIKGQLLERGGYPPYRIPLVNKVDQVANYWMQDRGYAQRLTFNQYFNNIFSRVGEQTGGIGNYIETTWTNVLVGAKNNAQSLGQMMTPGGNRIMGGGGGIGNTIGNLGQNINNVGNAVGKGANKVANNLGVNPSSIKNGMKKGLDGGNNVANKLLGATERMIKIPGLALGSVTPTAILAFIVIIIVAILLYSIFMSGSISSLVPPNGMAAQITPGAKVTPTPGDVIGGACYVTRNGIQLPIIPIKHNDICGTNKEKPTCGDLSKSVYVGDDFCSFANGKNGCYLEPHVEEMYKKMMDEASEYFAGDIEYLELTYGYRDFEGQVRMWNLYCTNTEDVYTCSLPGQETFCKPDGRAACPGNSEHQTGRGIDFSFDDNIKKYPRYGEYLGWLQKNAPKYGFERVNWEIWHWEYVAKVHEGETCVPIESKTTITPTVTPTPTKAPVPTVKAE